MVRIQGTVAAGYEPVRDVFIENFEKYREWGAACCIYVAGEQVVDLWGGERKAGEPWEEDTIVPVFSTTKGMGALALALAHSRGWLDYDEAISTYWPEFAQYGKEHFTVRDLLSHKLGLLMPPRKITETEIRDYEARAALLAQAAPAWEPGQSWGYHAVSLYLYGSELLHRVDPQGRYLQQFFQEEIAEPLGAEVYIGLPDHIPDERRAWLVDDGMWQRIKALWTSRHFYRGLVTEGSLVQRAFLPIALEERVTSFAELFNRREILEVENGSASGVASARGIARVYGEFATGGQKLGLQPHTLAELMDDPQIPPNGTQEIVLKLNMIFHLGLMRATDQFIFSEHGKAFGHAGLGGSVSFADPVYGMGFSYVMNRMTAGREYPRANRLLETAKRCVRQASARA